MAYSNKADAIAKLTDGFIDNDSMKIYTSDTAYNSNTVFYSDAAKTQLLSAGNYVIPTNYRTLWIQIGSDGKLSTAVDYLFTTASDASWANDDYYDRDINTTIGRESTWFSDVVITNNLITDNRFSENTWPGYTKMWSCNMGGATTTSLTNLDVSDMKGFDLFFFIGSKKNNGYYQYEHGKFCSAFVHIGQDINRQTVFTENGVKKIYFFKPDYWYAKENINTPTFFRRNGYLQFGDLKNQYGLSKAYDHMEDYVHDVVMPDKQTARTSTRRQRSLTDLLSFYNDYNAGEDGARNDSTYGLNWNIPGRYRDRTYYGHSKARGVFFDQPLCIMECFNVNVGHAYDPTNTAAGGSYDSRDLIIMAAMFRSMYLQQFTGTYTAWNMTCTYEESNPLHWTTDMPANINDLHPSHPIRVLVTNWQSHARGWYWDMESYNALGTDETAVRGLYACANAAYNYCKNNNLLDSNQKIVSYGDGVYRVENYYQVMLINSSNYTTAPLYLDYHGYMNGTITRQQLQGGYKANAYDYMDMQLYSFVLNYTHEYSPKYYFYLLCHSTDITRKLLYERFGTNSHGVRVSVYSWTVHDTVGAGQDLEWVIQSSNGHSARADHSPDFFQSLGAWGFGYADGVYQWNWGAVYLEDYNDINWNANWPPVGAGIAFNNFAAEDWMYWTQYALFQNKDIIEAPTEWIYAAQSKGDGTYTSGTENYPMTLYAFERPIITIKYNSAGTEALILAINPWNNGYTKSTKSIKLVNNAVISIDMWGNYTTIMRINL